MGTAHGQLCLVPVCKTAILKISVDFEETKSCPTSSYLPRMVSTTSQIQLVLSRLALLTYSLLLEMVHCLDYCSAFTTHHLLPPLPPHPLTLRPAGLDGSHFPSML